MALWDAADLLDRCRRHARRPVSDQAMPDANWYAFLTEAQPEAHGDLVSRFPDLAYTAPALLVSADGGYTYGFGNDADGDAARPMGHAEIYPNLQSIPDNPLTPGDDFLYEGALIRMLSNRTRLFSAGPYARMALAPDTPVSATSPPVLQPKPARVLLMWKALESWAARPGSGADPDYYAKRYDAALAKVWTDLATAYNRMGAQAAGAGGGAWWTALDLGANGLNV